MRRLLATALALCLSVPALAGSGPAPGDEYAQAREALLSAGWAAQTFPLETAGERCSYRTEICSTFREAEMCYGTGLGACAFVFAKADGTSLRVWTVGEEIADLTVDVIENPAR